jgi:hypothetical protein
MVSMCTVKAIFLNLLKENGSHCSSIGSPGCQLDILSRNTLPNFVLFTSYLILCQSHFEILIVERPLSQSLLALHNQQDGG